jgi:hypothetical protein
MEVILAQKKKYLSPHVVKKERKKKKERECRITSFNRIKYSPIIG